MYQGWELKTFFLQTKPVLMRQTDFVTNESGFLMSYYVEKLVQLTEI